MTKQQKDKVTTNNKVARTSDIDINSTQKVVTANQVLVKQINLKRYWKVIYPTVF